MITRTEKYSFFTARRLGQSLLAALAFALPALPAGAQTGSTASGAAGVTSSGSPRVAGNAAVSSAGTMVARDDIKMMADLAHGNLAEIETGKMALEKSKSEPVKKFAQ